MEQYNSINIWQNKQLPNQDNRVKNAMRHLDHTINITWVMQHLNVAIKYIDHSGRMVKQREVVTGKHAS
jgi:tryptophan 2,3-dioxygenase